jgi:hypothetical protein
LAPSTSCGRDFLQVTISVVAVPLPPKHLSSVDMELHDHAEVLEGMLATSRALSSNWMSATRRDTPSNDRQ